MDESGASCWQVDVSSNGDTPLLLIKAAKRAMKKNSS
jgi:hypothetical protein